MIISSLLVIITAFFGWQAQSLGFDFEFEKFFPRNHPETKLYQKHVEQFGYDNDFMQIILSHDQSVFNSAFLTNASQFEKELRKIKDIEKVFSPLSLQHAVKSPTGLVIFPLIHPSDSFKLPRDSVRIYGNDFYKAAFSEDAKSLSIYLIHAHFDDPERTEKLLNQIQIKAEDNGITSYRLVGKLSASQEFLGYIKTDFGKFLAASIVIGFVLLLLIFRNIKSAMLPFGISILSIIWLFGLMGSLGFEINLLSSLLPPILLFVSMSDAIHLINALNKANGESKKDRILEALNVVWTPTLLTSITTAIGFLSLLWINTEPVQLLGVFAAFGILFAFIITFSLGLVVASTTKFSSSRKILSIREGYLSKLQKRRKYIILSTIVVLLIFIPGISQLEINAFLLDDLPPESSVRKDFEFADSNLGGSKPYEIRIEVRDTSLSIWDRSIMNEIVKIEDYLLYKYPIVKVQSPATIIKYLTMVNKGGLNQFYQYPTSDRDYERTIRLKSRIDPKRMNKLVTEDGKAARLIGVFPEFGSIETERRNELLLSYLENTINHELIDYKITGTTYLIDKSHELLSTNLLMGLITAIGVVSLVLGMYFRSWKLLIISLIPNIIPLIMIAGILGWAGISLKMTSAIIFTISFGIAVDDTIHMMSNYLQNTGMNAVERMLQTLRHAGSAILITTLIMTAGFLLFLFSNFGASFFMGLFVSLSLTIALIIDLTLLPLMLMKYHD